jgi:hypothetical protein
MEPYAATVIPAWQGCVIVQTELSHAGGFVLSSHSSADHVIASRYFVLRTSLQRCAFVKIPNLPTGVLE